MKPHGFIKVLTEEQCKIAVNSVDDLYEHWVRREPEPWDFYTIGSTKYQDGIPQDLQYFEQMKKMNPILKEKFGWIYDIIIQNFSKVIGPCELVNELGHPGFHVLGHPPDQLNNNLTMKLMRMPVCRIHEDAPYNQMYVGNFLKTFENVDYIDSLSWTLLLESPTSGSGLATWNDHKMEKYEKNKEFASHVKALSDYENFQSHKSPLNVVTYNLGEAFFFVGNLTHQISPSLSFSKHDRRITMQGHGTLCDGIWRIYF